MQRKTRLPLYCGVRCLPEVSIEAAQRDHTCSSTEVGGGIGGGVAVAVAVAAAVVEPVVFAAVVGATVGVVVAIL